MSSPMLKLMTLPSKGDFLELRSYLIILSKSIRARAALKSSETRDKSRDYEPKTSLLLKNLPL